MKKILWLGVCARVGAVWCLSLFPTTIYNKTNGNEQNKKNKSVVWGIRAVKGFADTYFLTGAQDEMQKNLESNAAFSANTYRDQVAHVHVSNSVSNAESQATSKRLTKVHSAVEKLLGREIKVTPRIAVVASGGGYRAMLCTLGFLAGAEKIGLFDSTLWISSLSGSTWATALVYMNQLRANGTLTISAIRDLTISLVADKELYHPITDHEFDLIFDYFLLRAVGQLPFCPVALYGAFLANRLFANFGDQRHNIHFWQLQPLLEKGEWPIPIFTAVQGQQGFEREKREWFSFTPWQVESAWLGASIPTWSFGRAFKNGKSLSSLSENLGFLLGTCGSAFAVSVGDGIQELERALDTSSTGGKQKYDALQLLLHAFSGLPSAALSPLITVPGHSVVKSGQVADVRISSAVMHNYMFGMPQAKTKSPSMQLVDAGLAFNLPYPPISGERSDRAANIIIFLDTSHTIKEARYGNTLVVNQLRLAERYARRKNLKFPKIDYSVLHKRVISVFKDDTDPHVPVVIYLPRVNSAPNIKDPDTLSFLSLLDKAEFSKYRSIATFDVESCSEVGDCNAYNFNYSKKDAELLSLTTEFNMVASRNVIVKAIDDWVTVREGVVQQELQNLMVRTSASKKRIKRKVASNKRLGHIDHIV